MVALAALDPVGRLCTVGAISSNEGFSSKLTPCGVSFSLHAGSIATSNHTRRLDPSLNMKSRFLGADVRGNLFAFEAGHDGAPDGVTPNVDRRAAHVEKAIDRQNHADALERQSNGVQNDGHGY